MSNLGMRIKGDVFEVGFEAETREEFDSFVAKLQMVAGTIWPPSPAGARGIGDDEGHAEWKKGFDERHPPLDIEKIFAEAKAVTATWREGQGLR